MSTKVKIPYITFAVSVLFSVVLSSALTYQITEDAINRDKQFKVVDLNQLTKAMMKDLEQSIKENNVQMSAEMIQVLGQNEGKKLFTTIANTGGMNDIIIPKSSVIYSPDRYEITEDIAAKLGLTGIENKSLKEALNSISDKGE